jgi:hypothetical protein
MRMHLEPPERMRGFVVPVEEFAGLGGSIKHVFCGYPLCLADVTNLQNRNLDYGIPEYSIKQETAIRPRSMLNCCKSVVKRAGAVMKAKNTRFSKQIKTMK